MNTENNGYDQAEPPAWVMEFFNRLSSLEAKFASSPFLQEDPNVFVRSPRTDFLFRIDLFDEITIIRTRV